MVIKREIDGKLHKIKLTDEEIFKAYNIQQFAWDKDYCNTYFVDNYKNEEWFDKLSVNDIEGIICLTSSNYRRLLGKDYHEEVAIERAVRSALIDYNITI